MGRADKREGHPAEDLKGDVAGNGVQSLETGVSIALALAGAGKPLGVSELAAMSGLSASTVHRYLTSLTRSGLTEQLASNGKYDLGPKALYLGLQAIGRLDAQRHLSRVVEDLAADSGLTAQGMVWARNGPTIIQWKTFSAEVVVSARLGSHLPLLSSAAGLVFCAFLPPAMWRKQADAELAAAQPPTNMGKPLTSAALNLLLKEIKQEGVARVMGDLVPGIDAISAPAMDSQGDVAFALSLMGTRGAIDLTRGSVHEAHLRSAVHELSGRLGAHIT